MFRVDSHKWWTADRSRLVESGDTEAAFLAFTAGMEISEDEARSAGLLPSAKALGKPQDKALAKPADKAGLTINRSTKE